jgi:drug/metabolite transporter (DMT)-like permease
LYSERKDKAVSDTKFVEKVSRTGVIIALLAVYISWGSTYLAIRIALESVPPFFMMGIRFFIVGVGLYIFLKIKGAATPTLSQWANALLIGGLLFLGGGAGVAFAEQWVASGLTALVIATTPLWTVMFAWIWKHRSTKMELTGLVIGFIGIAILNLEGDLRASPLGTFTLIFAAISWSLGSIWSLRLNLPSGMMANAVEMIAGGILVLVISFFAGEKINGIPTWSSIGAIIYLAVFGSLVGFSAYMYLLRRVRPALATSYAYVNPVIAVILGIWLAGEKITSIGITAMVVIIVGVILVVFGQRNGA